MSIGGRRNKHNLRKQKEENKKERKRKGKSRSENERGGEEKGAQKVVKEQRTSSTRWKKNKMKSYTDGDLAVFTEKCQAEAEELSGRNKMRKEKK